MQTFLYRFAIGLALSAAAWLTGGLEASIALHAVNNVVLFLLAGALGDRAAAAEPGGVVGWGDQPARRARGWRACVAWVAVARAAGSGRNCSARRWTCAPDGRPGAGRDTRSGGVPATRSGASGKVYSRRGKVLKGHGVWGNWQPD